MCCDKWTKADYFRLTSVTLWILTLSLFVFAIYTDTLATHAEKDMGMDFEWGWEELRVEYTFEGEKINHNRAYCDGLEDDAEQSNKDNFNSLCDDCKIYVAFACISAVLGGVALMVDFIYNCCCTKGSCAGCAKTLISALYCCTFLGMVMTVIIIFRLVLPNTQATTFTNDPEPGMTTILMIICVVTSGIAVGFNFCFGCCYDIEADSEKIPLENIL